MACLRELNALTYFLVRVVSCRDLCRCGSGGAKILSILFRVRASCLGYVGPVSTKHRNPCITLLVASSNKKDGIVLVAQKERHEVSSRLLIAHESTLRL